MCLYRPFIFLQTACHTTAHTQLEAICMLRSSQFESGTCPCVAIVADSARYNSCMSACVVTYTWIAFQALTQARPRMMQQPTSFMTCVRYMTTLSISVTGISKLQVSPGPICCQEKKDFTVILIYLVEAELKVYHQQGGA